MTMFGNLPKFVFFTGKGGVGKTSLASATALSLAYAGKKVLLVSTDPASNVGQVFETEIGNRITSIPSVADLDAIEINPEEAATQYRVVPMQVDEPIGGDRLRALCALQPSLAWQAQEGSIA
jgi:anion-transporting  ArsA/GET3 family ATPase